MSRKPVTEADARRRGWEAGQKSMRKAKRISWNRDDAAVAIAEYRRLTGHPDATVQAARAALDELDRAG